MTLCSSKTIRLPMGKKPRIRIYSDNRMELMNSFMYWSDDFQWFICEHYVNYYNSLRNL